LNDRGIPIPKEHVDGFNKKINEELRKGQKGHLGWMAFYFILATVGGLLVSPFFLLGGIGMGWYYWQDKTVDNEGGKFYTFEKNTRFYGQVIFYLGWLSILAGALLLYFGNGPKSLSIHQHTQQFQVESVL
jgi:hypothetical protein